MKIQTVMVNNSTNIHKINNYLSPKIIEYYIYGIWNQGSELVQTQQNKKPNNFSDLHI